MKKVLLATILTAASFGSMAADLTASKIIAPAQATCSIIFANSTADFDTDVNMTLGHTGNGKILLSVAKETLKPESDDSFSNRSWKLLGKNDTEIANGEYDKGRQNVKISPNQGVTMEEVGTYSAKVTVTATCK